MESALFFPKVSNFYRTPINIIVKQKMVLENLKYKP